MKDCTEEKRIGSITFSCYFELTTKVLDGKWNSKILCQLVLNDAMRFNELKRAVKGITSKMLTQTLKKLQQDELICRTVHGESPPKVEYALTPLGALLATVLTELGEWGRMYASYLLAKQYNEEYELGTVYEDLDERVKRSGLKKS